MRIKSLVLYTSYLSEVRDFYAAIGFNFIKEQHGKGPEHYAAVSDDGFLLEIYPSNSEANVARIRIGIEVTNVPHIVSNLKYLYMFNSIRKVTDKEAILRDPDGRTVVLNEKVRQEKENEEGSQRD